MTSKAAKLANELKELTHQIDRLEAGACLELDVGPNHTRRMEGFHLRVASTVREHAIAILKAARAELLVEVAKEVGLPARFEEGIEEAVVVQHPPVPQAPALPLGDEK